MHITKLAWTFGLLGLAAANPWPKVSLDDSLLSHQDLAIRQETEDICSIATCGDEAECLATRDVIPSLATRDDYYSTNDTDEDELSLLKRDIDRPNPGQLDGWFKAVWDSGKIVNVPHDEDDYTARYREFLKDPFKLGVKGMCGCTSVIVASKKGVYLSHHWENPSLKGAFEKQQAPPGQPDGEAAFQLDVIQELHDSLTCIGFNKNDDKELQVFIYTKVDTTANPKTIKYGPQIDQIKDKVAERIPGLSKGDIKDIMYYTHRSASESTDTADGKVIVSYDPKAGGGKAAYQVWAGSVFQASGRIDNALVNSPIGEASWAPTDTQR
ncbi:hypothetical protein ACHAQA_004724 [Verticillium albo-atrum]